ncbi:hypothetical protein BGW38_005695 [Lunasporangiospora selenospora]|uniref:START domain-containing protein n=1 Tax=Lunasporangiospora selenospora TaxID=979761 RepID=A0A9P6G065_9FUNG|nr:hypothetical protein BGW38_005695 [Lunasporangiospora selenospora]
MARENPKVLTKFMIFIVINSPRDALLIETTLLDHNAVLHIATSIKPSHDDPIFLRPSPPHVRAYLPLVAWHIQLVPADLEDTVSFTSFNSLTASQHKPLMPRHSIRVSFYYQIDMRGWAVNSSVSMQSHVPSCIANVYRLLRRQGVPPHVSRHSPRIQLDLNEYDPATGIYELRYDVIPPDPDEMPVERKTVSSALKQFRLSGTVLEGLPEYVKEAPDPSSMPQEIVLSDEDDPDDVDNANSDELSKSGYVDVELDGERWGRGSDIVVHIFMNDIEDEEFVQEHVECLKYMGRDRYILRMKHSEIGEHHGAINVKLRIERIPQHSSSSSDSTNLLSHQQLRLQRQQQQLEHTNRQLLLQQRQDLGQDDNDSLVVPDMNGLVVSVNGLEKDILPFHRRSITSSRQLSMSLQEQLELSQQIVQEVDVNISHLRAGSDSQDGQDARLATSPLLLMSSSMSATIQSLGRSNQSVLSNGTSTMAPGNTNPSVVNKSYSYFNSLLQESSSSWKSMTKTRGVNIAKLDVQGHAPGIVKGEGVFENYTIWDIKAALDCASARKIWDKLFDESQMLQHATPSSILSYVRLKGFWPTSPKDMAVLNTTFITKSTIHYFATSVDDTNQYPSIPPPVSPFVRSEVAVSGWFLETVKPKGVRMVYIAQATPTGWMVPGTALSAMTTEMPLCIAEIIKYLESFGSPPTLVSIRRGRALGLEYSHEKISFRLEYVQDSNPIFSGHRALIQQHQQQRKSLVDYSSGSPVSAVMGVTSADEKNLQGSPMFGPMDKLLAEIRLDARVWAKNGDCDMTIDPPPSKVTCTSVPHDSTGLRIRIEHSSGRAVPAGGKVLVMVKRAAKAGCGVVVNGEPIKMPSLEHLSEWMPSQAAKSDKDRALTLSMVDGALAEKEKEGQEEDDAYGTDSKAGTIKSSVVRPLDKDSVTTGSHSASSSSDQKTGVPLSYPMHYAQNAMVLLSKIKSDPEDSWTLVSDSKDGLKVTKRFMPTEISEQVPLVRGEKVIEGFSLEEIATVIGTLGTRSKLDDLFDSGELLESYGAGCASFHHVLKGYFLLPLPARDLYFVTATVAVEPSARCPQVAIVSTSIPPEAINTNITSSETLPADGTSSANSKQHARPRAHLHLSAWILEAIDPYSSSHPIPSTRVTFMMALDLGGSVPQRVSGMVQTMFPKIITHVENYLQHQAAPPIVRVPHQMVIKQHSQDYEHTESSSDETPEMIFQLPKVVPWVKPANKMITWEFKMKDSFFQMQLLFDQFQLSPSRLSLASARRTKRNKKQQQKSKSEQTVEGSKLGSRDEGEDEERPAGDDTLDHPMSRTVLELVVDLKQYPIGYNIITNIKVDPEFLLQHKQQRDAMQKSASTTSIVKSSISSSNLPGVGSSTTSNTKFIGGLDHLTMTNGSSSGAAGLAESVSRVSLDGDSGFGSNGSRATSEAASTGTGIAAVLVGGSNNVPRALPSSTSLIRIVPPPITVHVIDIPPAPSHSSSLLGVSKLRKHLIIVTVPEAESSLSHLHAQQQTGGSAGVKRSVSSSMMGSSSIRSTATTRPMTMVNLASSSAGLNSEDPSSIDSVSVQSIHHETSSLDSEHDSVKASPTFSPGKQPSAAHGSLPSLSASQQYQDLLTDQSNQSPTQPLETRMFQIGVKIDRLEHKDMDHMALKNAKEALLNNPGTATEDDWMGKVMVDGLPVKILHGWSRQGLGFLDGMMEDGDNGDENHNVAEDDNKEEVRSGSLRSRRYGSLKGRPSNFEVHDDVLTDEEALTPAGDAAGIEEDEVSSRTVSRRRKHHHQQLLNMNERLPTESTPRRASFAVTTDSSKAQKEDNRRKTIVGSPEGRDRPTSTFANFFGFFGGGSRRSSKVAHQLQSPVSPSQESPLREQLALNEDEHDDDRTIRASKSVSRGGLGTILNGKGAKQQRKEMTMDNGGHDLDLESLHGSIVFKERGLDSEYDYEHRNEQHDDMHEDSDGARYQSGGAFDREMNGRESVRRHKGERVLREMRRSSKMSRGHNHDGEDEDEDEEPSGSDDAQYELERRDRRVGRSSRSVGSTNGADHPRFRGSQLYAYSFRNLFWSAIGCFLIGLLLRLFVIGPSFLKAVTSSTANGGWYWSKTAGGIPPRATPTYYYYYYRAVPRNRPNGESTDPLLTRPFSGNINDQGGLDSPRLGSGHDADTLETPPLDRNHDRIDNGEGDEEYSGIEGPVRPQGVRELFTIRRLLGWDIVLIAYPSQQSSQQQSPLKQKQSTKQQPSRQQ